MAPQIQVLLAQVDAVLGEQVGRAAGQPRGSRTAARRTPRPSSAGRRHPAARRSAPAGSDRTAAALRRARRKSVPRRRARRARGATRSPPGSISRPPACAWRSDSRAARTGGEAQAWRQKDVDVGVSLQRQIEEGGKGRDEFAVDDRRCGGPSPPQQLGERFVERVFRRLFGAPERHRDQPRHVRRQLGTSAARRDASPPRAACSRLPAGSRSGRRTTSRRRRRETGRCPRWS